LVAGRWSVAKNHYGFHRSTRIFNWSGGFRVMFFRRGSFLRIAGFPESVKSQWGCDRQDAGIQGACRVPQNVSSAWSRPTTNLQSLPAAAWDKKWGDPKSRPRLDRNAPPCTNDAGSVSAEWSWPEGRRERLRLQSQIRRCCDSRCRRGWDGTERVEGRYAP
jgi:hypothetical protein